MRIPPIQEIIHWLEIGQGARVLRNLVGLLCLLTLTFWYDFYQFRNFSAPEAMEAAQLARNLSRGEGFTTQVVRPLAIQLVEDAEGVDARLGRKPPPDLFNPPAYPLLLAGWMKLLPFRYDIGDHFWQYQPELLIAILNQLLLFFSAWLLYRLTKRLIGGDIGVLVAVVLLTSQLLWQFSVSGLSTILLIALVTGLMWVLVLLEEAARSGTRRRWWFVRWGALAGLLLGLAGLTRYAALVLIVPVTLFALLFLGRRTAVVLAMTWVTCAVVVTPWLVRNYHVSGTLFGIPGYAIYQDTTRFPDTRLERSTQPDLAVVQNQDFIRKVGEGLRQVLSDDLLRLGGSWVGAFFLVGLLGQYRNPALNRLRVFLLLSLAALGLAQSLGRTHLSTDSPHINTENLLVLLTPGVFLLGAAFYAWLLDRFDLPFPEFRHVLSTLVAIGAAAPLLAGFLPPRSIPIVYPPYYPPYLQEASQFLKPNELLMSDMPWATAWYGDRRSVWTPLDYGKSFFAINDDQQVVSAVLLSPLSTDAQFRRQILQDRDYDWSRLAVEVFVRTNVPTGFPLTQAWSRGTPDHLFLTDRARWQRDALAFAEEDLADLPALARKLKAPARPFDTWLAARLSAATKAALTNEGGPDSDLGLLRTALSQDLNAILIGPSIYDAQRFNGIDLRPQTVALLTGNPQSNNLVRLNRMLIEDAYPLELSRNRPATRAAGGEVSDPPRDE